MSSCSNHGVSINQIEEVLRAVGKAQLFTCLSYPGAGHLIEPPYSPNTSVSLWRAKPKKGMLLSLSLCFSSKLNILLKLFVGIMAAVEQTIDNYVRVMANSKSIL